MDFEAVQSLLQFVEGTKIEIEFFLGMGVPELDQSMET
jgi:hypothetical protein